MRHDLVPLKVNECLLTQIVDAFPDPLIHRVRFLLVDSAAIYQMYVI